MKMLIATFLSLSLTAFAGQATPAELAVKQDLLKVNSTLSLAEHVHRQTNLTSEAMNLCRIAGEAKQQMLALQSTPSFAELDPVGGGTIADMLAWGVKELSDACDAANSGSGQLLVSNVRTVINGVRSEILAITSNVLRD